MSTPSISSITPGSGRAAGGQSVTIFGADLAAVTVVTIGGNYATNLSIVSSTQITCNTPAGSVGAVDVIAAAYGSTWTQNTSAPDGAWSGVAMSTDGTIQTAIVRGGGIYTWDDLNATWILNTSAPTTQWRQVAMSSNGQIQTALVDGAGIYTSINYGVDFSLNISAPSQYWYGVAMSQYGMYQTATSDNGGIYTSINSGADWALNTVAPNPVAWRSVAMSSNGLKQTALVSGVGIYTSINSGADWALNTSAPASNWIWVAMSSDGAKQTATVNGGGIYTSSDYGDTWFLNLSAPNPVLWYGLAMSLDGTIQTATVSGGSIYTSSDSGATWSQNTYAPTPVPWRAVAMSSDGAKQTAGINNGGLWSSVATFSNSLTYTYTEPAISNICFPAGTPITTDQGNISIEKINPDIHTIHNNKIVAITKTITQDTYLVCFEKHALGFNKPNKKTITSKNHKVYYNGKMTKAHHFLKQFKHVSEIVYDGEILYNVLMEKHDKLQVNNVTFETLDPENIIAKLYTSGFDEEYKNKIIVMINHSIMQKDTSLYQNIINRIVNDKTNSTWFDEPEYNEPEYNEPEYKQLEYGILDEAGTTRIETINNYANKPSHTPAVKISFNLENNVNLNGKLSKYIKSRQTKDNTDESVKISFNLENNVNLNGKLSKYIKSHQTKDDTDELVKKKDFLNKKKEEKEDIEKERRSEREKERLRERPRDKEKKRDKTQKLKIGQQVTFSTSRKTYKNFLRVD